MPLAMGIANPEQRLFQLRSSVDRTSLPPCVVKITNYKYIFEESGQWGKANFILYYTVSGSKPIPEYIDFISLLFSFMLENGPCSCDLCNMPCNQLLSWWLNTCIVEPMKLCTVFVELVIHTYCKAEHFPSSLSKSVSTQI